MAVPIVAAVAEVAKEVATVIKTLCEVCSTTSKPKTAEEHMNNQKNNSK